MKALEDMRIALVSGAAQGIGRAVARRLLVDGYRLWCFDCDAAALDQMCSALPADLARHAHAITGDVGDEADVRHCMSQIHDAHGRLDVLVNNAGIANPVNGPIEDLALADWEQLIRTNLTGCFLLAKHAVPLLRAASGCIVNMASSRALQSEPHTEAYAASKGGIQALTHALSISLGPQIRVNAIAPGWIDVRAQQKDGPAQPEALREIDHAQHPVGRVGRPEDIGGIVAFLCSGDAAFITGQTVIADGGMTRKMIYAH